MTQDKKSPVPAKDPSALPLLALRGMAVFPGMVLSFDVGRKKSVLALNDAMRTNQQIFLVAQKDLRDDEPGAAGVFDVGTVGHIQQILHLGGDGIKVLVEGLYRAKLDETVSDDPFISALVTEIEEPEANAGTVRAQALIRRAQELTAEYAENGPKLPQEVYTEIMAATEPGKLADYIASNIFMRYEDKQAVLESLNPLRRLALTLKILDRELGIVKLEQDINGKIHAEIDKNQRDYYLREQIKVLSEELGDAENPQDEADEYHDRIDALKLPEETAEKLHKEAERLYRMPVGSHEGTVVRTWLDTCLDLPWNKYSKDSTDLDHARKVLDSTHYGLDKLKERIIEFIAVKKLAPDLKGQIICLVGPPGVGKTSIAKSIAKALGRKYARVSLGGSRDEADIRGHRKTYIGAMPGRIITAMTQAGTKNPVLLLDEVDKMFEDFHGDPSAALLEVLDSEQNMAFRDHFIEVPFDLSDVLFITTANTSDTIPAPLLDRMEVMELPSYTREEKFNIVKRHLISKQLKRHGLTRRNLRITDAAIYELIDYYTREAGVRNAERELASLCRKAARKIAAGETACVRLDAGGLESLLGPHKFRPEAPLQRDEIGVVTGLAWTSVGGETMPIESCVLEGTGKVELTGSLGDVMKESAKAAISYIRSRADELGIDREFYKTKDIHIHVPEGAVPKDGPSAGVTMATALASALTKLPVRRDVAMTGEITLRGRVLPIGGLREKTMAAYRAGIKTVVIPRDNLADLAEIDKTVKENIKFVSSDTVDAFFRTAIIFPEEKPETGAKSKNMIDASALAAGAQDNARTPAFRQ
jgi:ATP-dependent Lon protease